LIAAIRARLTVAGVELGLSLVVAAAALAIAFIFIAASGASFGQATEAFFDGGFGSRTNVAGTLSKMVPLVFVALGWIVVFRAGRFHVGFPGQILIGGLLVSIVALKLSLPPVVHLPLAMLAGMVGGALYAGITAWLWAKRGVNEILSTLLLNLIAIQVISWVVRGPLQHPGSPLPQTSPLDESARWPALLAETSLRWDFVLIPVVIAAAGFVLTRTTFGFKLRLVGDNETVARHAGVSPQRVGVYAILLSGLLAGLAGSSLLLAGSTPVMTDNFDEGVGFQGIAVALLARNSPVGVIPAALLFATLQQSSGTMEATLGISSAVVDVTQGIVIILVLAATSLLYLVRRSPTAVLRAPVARTEQGELV
jgi:simple sugar transport system permease protein